MLARQRVQKTSTVYVKIHERYLTLDRLEFAVPVRFGDFLVGFGGLFMSISNNCYSLCFVELGAPIDLEPTEKNLQQLV